jgi:hypothetical protein
MVFTFIPIMGPERVPDPAFPWLMG